MEAQPQNSQKHADALKNTPLRGTEQTPDVERINYHNSLVIPTNIDAAVLRRAIANPRQASPATILQLQRTLGNRAVGRLLKGESQKQKQPAQTENAQVIQRRIGFEVETGIPLTKRKKKKGGTSTYHNLFVSDVGDDLKISNGKGKFSPDHIPGSPKHKASAKEQFDDWPIIELVTDPIDDTLELDAFEVIAKNWIDNLKLIKTEAKKSPPAKNLKDKYYVGLPTAQAYGSWDRIAPQVTVGVPLDQVNKILAGFNVVSGTVPQFNANKYGQEAPKKATTIIQNLLDKYPTADGAGVQALKGLLTLMCNYLLVGGDAAISNVIYMKNRPSNVFYKSKLSTVRQNIMDMSFPSTVLGKPKARTYLRDQLLTVTGRPLDAALFIEGNRVQSDGLKGGASAVTVGGWINEVLRGVDDRIFDEMKNEWSTDINPDAKNEVVIELRRIGDFVLHDNYQLEDDKGLLDFMKKVYLANKAIKQRKT